MHCSAIQIKSKPWPIIFLKKSIETCSSCRKQLQVWTFGDLDSVVVDVSEEFLLIAQLYFKCTCLHFTISNLLSVTLMLVQLCLKLHIVLQNQYSNLQNAMCGKYLYCIVPHSRLNFIAIYTLFCTEKTTRALYCHQLYVLAVAIALHSTRPKPQVHS